VQGWVSSVSAAKGQVACARQGVVHERAAKELAVAVGRGLGERLADALREPPWIWPSINVCLLSPRRQHSAAYLRLPRKAAPTAGSRRASLCLRDGVEDAFGSHR
jgi:hypothetical protein